VKRFNFFSLIGGETAPLRSKHNNNECLCPTTYRCEQPAGSKPTRDKEQVPTQGSGEKQSGWRADPRLIAGALHQSLHYSYTKCKSAIIPMVGIGGGLAVLASDTSNTVCTAVRRANIGGRQPLRVRSSEGLPVFYATRSVKISSPNGWPVAESTAQSSRPSVQMGCA